MIERDGETGNVLASEMRFRSVAQSANDAIITSDSTGNIIFWNNGARAIFGYSEEEALGMPLSILMPQRYRDAHEAGMERVHSTGETHVIGHTVELHGLRADGTEFPLELSLAMWQEEGVTFYSGIIRDITERRETESRIQELNAELERRVEERTAELESANTSLQAQIRRAEEAISIRDELLRVVSHDLKNPLGGITTNLDFAGILLMRAGNTERVWEALKRARMAAHKMTSMVEELLDFGRLQANLTIELQREIVDLAAMLRETVSQYAPSSGGPEIRLEVMEERFTSYWDGSRLERVFANLLTNAIKYSPDGGDIAVTLGMQSDTEGTWAVVTFSDEGIGIPPGDLPFIFEWYRRARNVKGRISGSGIGLATSRRIVEQHGGDITAASQEGVGTTFTVRLPL